MTDLLLLAALLAGPRHGYALKKQIGLLSGNAAMHNNLVYPLLKRFVQQGWVSRRATAGERGQTREVYSLTKAGKQVLLDRLGELSDRDAGSADALRIRVGLFGFLGAGQRHEILQKRDKWLAARQDRLRLIAQKQPMDIWATEVVRFICKQTDMEREWLGRLAKLAKKSAK
jgi:DNA-binding PadR family transcriptional regulator